MKKLLLLAVVVFGFSTLSIGQNNQAGVGIQGQVQGPVNVNATFSVNAINDMDFGYITNNATATAYGIMIIPPSGSPTTPGNFISYTGSPKPAQFLCKGAGTVVAQGDIVVSPTSYTVLGTGLFETDATTTYTGITTNGTAGQYVIKVGGKLTLPKGASGTISVTGLTITVNNH
jgi:hypothetical protein